MVTEAESRETQTVGGPLQSADRPLLVLVGPTAAGKTALGLHLALEFDGEIISADSRLLYREMNIGTAKPTAAERSLVRHHLVDVCQPDETLTLAEYQRLAYAAIEDVQAREHLPVLLGGTGQYVKAVVEGWNIPRVPPQPRLREALDELGGLELARWLRLLDPEAFARIDVRNVRRIIRALEVTLVSGCPISHLQRKTPPPFRIQMIGLHRDRDELYRRIDARVDQMMAAGLLAEVERLRDAGYNRRLPAMSGLGYRQLWSYLAGEVTLEEAVERIKFETHRFARQQATWFRLDDPDIKWFHWEKDGATIEVKSFIRDWLQ